MVTIDDAVWESIRPRVVDLVRAVQSETPEAIRLEFSLTPRDLADRSGVSDETISRIERGLVKKLRPDTCKALANAIGCDPRRYIVACINVRETNGAKRGR